MKNWLLPLLLLTAACATVPYTHRHQLDLISRSQEIQLGNDAYAQVLKENQVSTNQEYVDRVTRVGQRIAAAADQKDFQWEYKVLKSTEVNAFCLPGGKVAFWEGIMPICGDDNGVAVVMGHEVAHALASHGAERMSQGMGAELIGNILSVGLSKSDPVTQQRTMQLFGVGTQVGVLLPFGRAQESEADHIGLILMAKAGYDPRAAVPFWERMQSMAGGQAPPQFLSTHPSDQTRINQIKAWIPEAMQYYKPKD